MKRYQVVLATLLLLVGVAGVVGAAGGPLADAGLDQEVGVNTTVQLDGTGSTHPNGTIDRYEWSIRTPAGREIAPNCRDCARTRFTPHETGRYEVTLTLTDEEGRTDSDTLYVDVEAAGPTVELDGPTSPRVDESVAYNASAATKNAALEDLTWKVGNRTVASESLSGGQDTAQREFSFDNADTSRLAVVVTDSRNRTARDTLLVEPREQPDEPSDVESDDQRDLETGDTDGTAEETCTQVGVVGNPSGSGTAAAVTCISTTDGDGTDTDSPTWSDETCGIGLAGCDLAAPNGGGGAGRNDGDSWSDSNGGVWNSGGSDEDSGPDESNDSAGGGSSSGWVV